MAIDTDIDTDVGSVYIFVAQHNNKRVKVQLHALASTAVHPPLLQTSKAPKKQNHQSLAPMFYLFSYTASRRLPLASIIIPIVSLFPP